jgi:NAD(P)-dependent dehydrogenase (short-subunit alcohol dehydrogenase family)
MNQYLDEHYRFAGRVAVITGGTGLLLSPAVEILGELGANLVILSTRLAKAKRRCAELQEKGIKAIPFEADVTDKQRLEEVADEVLKHSGRIDILINGAGGNLPHATVSANQTFFDLTPNGWQDALDLNLTGAFYCCQSFGKNMADRGDGVILNVASMASIRPLTRIAGYSAAKSALANFTQWLAVYLAQNFSPNIRVNAIAPGFLLTEQNRSLLTEDGEEQLSARGQTIISQTPMGRFGEPEEMTGAVLWLLSDAARFVTGVVLPVDGGFSAFSGV